MRKLLLIFAVLLSFTGYSKAIPSPSVFLRVSEKILSEAHSLVFPSEKVIAPKCDDKSNIHAVDSSQNVLETIWNPAKKIRREGMWIVLE